MCCQHAGELFALPFQMLFDAGAHGNTIDLPLWSGLHLQALAVPAGQSAMPTPAGLRMSAAPSAATGAGQRRLRDIETALIRRTVEETRGNVAEAAARLGVSRATVYRRLGMRRA